MNVAEFIAKWKKADLKERSAAQEHFIDLCRLVGHPTPAEADPTGATFCFEKGAAKYGGGDGFADVWKQGFFEAEYKGKHKDLTAAFDQLLLYKDAVGNPPLLMVCDMDRIVIRTNFTGTVPVTYEIPLEKLGEPRNLEILNHVFFDPEKLKPGKTSAAITQEAAQHFAGIADSMRARALDSGQVAHFLDRIVFCLFAEDIGLLPDMVFTRIVEKSAADPGRFAKLIGQLFEAMAHGGDFGMETIRHFNGSLFDGQSVLDVTPAEVTRIAEAAQLDWSAVDPSIFGTLFERGLDPAKRSQLGAHFTGRADIEEVVENVVMVPLRREWAETRVTIESLLTTGKKSPIAAAKVPPTTGRKPSLKKATGEATSIAHQFLTRLQTVKVLDPACGSGNFLYVTLLKLKDLEKEVILYAMEKELGGFFPMVGPWQLYGIEINPYAFDLAQMTVWIGWLQWIRFNGFGQPEEPILRPMTGNFRCMDAILESGTGFQPVIHGQDARGTLREPEWETVDCIVGNPPFLGDKMMRRELGDDYVDKLRTLYAGRIPGQSDLCCYWFEKARAHIAAGKCKRAGLLGTQNIRGGASRKVLEGIKKSGSIFWAVSDRDWVLDGASVHVSMVGFDGGAEDTRILDAKPVAKINSNLTATADVTDAKPLQANVGMAFIGNCKGGPFDIEEPEALVLLHAHGNPHSRPNSDVLRPVLNSDDLFTRRPQRWLIDNASMDLSEACLYEAPHAIVEARVKPQRNGNRDRWLRENWWRPQRMRAEMRRATQSLPRFMVTPTTSKHRIYCWLQQPTLPDHKLVVFARSDDYFYGLLHSRLHEVWARAQGTQLRERESGLNYNVQSSFETFPFPPTTPEQELAIGEAAKWLDQARENWLNPPEWTREEILDFPGTVGGPWDRFIDPSTISHQPSDLAVGTVKYPRLVSRDPDSAANLAKRTLTNLYNQRPAWLADAHRRLDAAVFAVYGWDPILSDDQLLQRLLDLNLGEATQIPRKTNTTDTANGEQS